MKSLTIYINEDDFEKVKAIAKQERSSVSQWYRQLTRYGFYLHRMQKAEPKHSFDSLQIDF